jgi:hypothetical protein
VRRAETRDGKERKGKGDEGERADWKVRYEERSNRGMI